MSKKKIERYHRSMKNVVNLDIYFSLDELRCRLKEFVDYYNNERDHESLQNLTPADVYLRRDKDILEKTKNVLSKTTSLKCRKVSLNFYSRLFEDEPEVRLSGHSYVTVETLPITCRKLYRLYHPNVDIILRIIISALKIADPRLANFVGFKHLMSPAVKYSE